MSLRALEGNAALHALEILGLCHAEPGDGLGQGTIALIGAREPGFWGHLQNAPEFADGAPDPMDRWSERVITQIAEAVGGAPLFPFGDPVRPFFSWALRSGRAWPSPVMLLVHDRAGLLISYRGAVLLDALLDIPEPPSKPCDTCTGQPCRTACPVGALTDQGYDIPACTAYLATPDGQDCLTQGCQVRRACPVSQAYPRDPAQSGFHMAAFFRSQTM